jgi:hypothetical protein
MSIHDRKPEDDRDREIKWIDGQAVEFWLQPDGVHCKRPRHPETILPFHSALAASEGQLEMNI